MINVNTLESTHPLCGSDNKVKVIEGTPLSIVTSGVLQAIEQKVAFAFGIGKGSDDNVSVNMDCIELANQISEMSKDPSLELNSQGAEFNTLTNTLTKIMKNNIYMARNIVLPLIDRYTEKVNERINQQTFANGFALDISDDAKKFILELPELDRLVRNIDGKFDSDAPLPRFHHDLNPSQIMTAMITGNKSLDDAIANWIVTNSLQSTLENVYKDLFVVGDYKGFGIGKYLSFDEPEVAIMTLMLAYGLQRDVQDNINVNATQYETVMYQVINNASYIVKSAIDNYSSATKHSRVVAKYPPAGRHLDFTSNNIIQVNQHVYNKFLEQGGSPEILFGAYLSDRETKLEALLDRKLNYIRTYNRVRNEGTLIRSNNVLTAVKQCLIEIGVDIAKDLAELQTEEKISEYGLIELVDEQYRKQIVDFTKNIFIDQVDDIYPLVRNFVCDIFFAGTEVKDLLNRIDLIDPKGEQDVNDVAIIACADLIVDWLMAQVEVVR